MSTATFSTTTLRRRLFAGAGALVFFAVFFAAPLYAAATICTMACCHHNAAGQKLTTDASGCDTDCSVRADDVTTTAASRFVAPAATAIAQATPVVSAITTAVPRPDADLSPPATSPPLHLLNSTFRI